MSEAITDIGDGVNTFFRTAAATRAPIRRDPLAIDLDGDGIETVGITATPVLFDHNADGIKTGTGWVKADDAWLALDRDGNGLIDSGRELFGADTVLSGTVGVDAVYATTGFQALKTLDANNDNVFDASDAAFTQVRIWQDTNQDGISQSTELFTLAQKGIASISLNATGTVTNLGNGNVVSGTALALPEMHGSGWVRGKHPARCSFSARIRIKTGCSPRGICASSYKINSTSAALTGC
jgi:hypothetical protein